MYIEKEFGGSIGAVLVTSTIDAGVYNAPSEYHIYAVVPDPSVTVKATPAGETTNFVSSTRGEGGVAIVTTSGFTGQYSSITVTAGQCFVYIRKNTSEI